MPQPWFEPKPIRDAEFRLFQGLVYREAGIFLGEAKRTLLVGRLSKRMRELGVASFGDYHELVVRGGGDELATMLDYTSFVRTNILNFSRSAGYRRYVRPSPEERRNAYAYGALDVRRGRSPTR